MLSRNKFLEIANDVVHGFEVDKQNLQAVELIYKYIIRDKAFESSGMSLDKGIMLTGNPGSGKTGLLKIMQRILAAYESPMMFKRTEVWKVVMAYTKTGYDAFDNYDSFHWFFDELGKKKAGENYEVVSNYGNKTNVAEMLIDQRYLLFENNSLLTHFTTNLSYSDLKEYYHERIISRINMMCNIIPVTGTDRRKTAKLKPVEDKVEVKPVIDRIEFYKGFNASGIVSGMKTLGELKKEETERKAESVQWAKTREYKVSKLKATCYEYFKIMGVNEIDFRNHLRYIIK